jgi:quercetin dioxygenase-like cupin family protein
VLGARHLNKILPESGTALVVEVCLQPGGGAPIHRHSEDREIFYIISGELTVEVDGECAVMRAGDVCHLPTGSAHGFRNAGNVDTLFLAIAIPGHDAHAFFTEIDHAMTYGAPEPKAIVEMARPHGLEIVGG